MLVMCISHLCSNSLTKIDVKMPPIGQDRMREEKSCVCLHLVVMICSIYCLGHVNFFFFLIGRGVSFMESNNFSLNKQIDKIVTGAA